MTYPRWCRNAVGALQVSNIFLRDGIEYEIMDLEEGGTWSRVRVMAKRRTDGSIHYFKYRWGRRVNWRIG